MARVRLLRSLILLVSIGVVLAGCGGDASDGDGAEGRPPGGAESLPGPVPADVSFSEGGASSPRAPDFSLNLMDGTPIAGPRLWRERPVVLFFFASWCGICGEQQSDLTGLSEEYRDRVLFLGIAGEDTQGPVAAYLDQHRVPYPVAIDPDLGVWRSFGVREPPHVVIISKGGRVIRGWPGGASRDLIVETLETMIAS